MTADTLRSSPLDAAAEFHRSTGCFAWPFARGNLRGDPAFTVADYPMSAGTLFANVLLVERPR